MTTISLHDTATRRTAPFVPLDPRHVRMYVCGPTVYDSAHIGNARPVVVFDLLFRLLRHVYGEGAVTYVRNITDVDDKIMERAAKDYPDLPFNEGIRSLTLKTEARFKQDAATLGALAPSREPRATENIDAMVDITQRLLARGHAYEVDGHVLFDIRSMPNYGALSRKPVDGQDAVSRLAVDDRKRNEGDFVLWKPSGTDQPGWHSPWGFGRPGWHIECSAMSDRWLWEHQKGSLSTNALSHPHAFDIHGGGLDLMFPHHENEVAQSCCAFGTDRMANVWMHNGFLTVDGHKMSKSAGNFITIQQLLETDTFGGTAWPGDVLRLALLLTHYRSPLDFTVGRLREARSMLEKWRKAVDHAEATDPSPDVVAVIADDLDFHSAAVALDRLANSGTDEGRGMLAGSLEFLGFHPAGVAKRAFSDDETAAILSVIDRRLKSIADGDYEAADALRRQLALDGIILTDTKDPDTKQRTTTWHSSR